MIVTMSKADAIKKIIDSPGDTVKMAIMDEITLIHEPVVNICKDDGVSYIHKSKKVKYNDNDFFGVLSLYDVIKDAKQIHYLMFAQTDPTDS